MPGARSRVKPATASEFSASDEASQLEIYLQRQLEEDVARIFDESIYSDLEVVCGKLKILTHSCILKARTKKFYHKLETILHVNIGRNTFDEIYSFISDAYTECNIKHQEKEIITFLDDKLNICKSNPSKTLNLKEDEADVFLTPKCVSPFIEKCFHKAISASPSIELTKEYYALVPIDGNLLEKELIEQDALSNAFHSIKKSQLEDFNKVSQHNKPTSLFSSSSHLSKTVKHSSSCDILNNQLINNITIQNLRSNNQVLDVYASQSFKSGQILESSKNIDHICKNSDWDTNFDKSIDPAYSPDSLITDDPSSSSDYLSAAYTCSPVVSSAYCIPQVNVGDNIIKMENVFTSSDSGLETGLLESLGSHKDVTLTDLSLSLTESTLTADDANDSTSASSSFADKNQLQRLKYVTYCNNTGSSSDKEMNGSVSNQTPKVKDVSSSTFKSSKEEKQRQNEEIVILESSSLSSETGSWESVFPPKLAEKEVCEKFIYNEQHAAAMTKEINRETSNYTPDLCPSLVQKSPFKSTSCFIDASSLADEEDDTIKIQTDINEIQTKVRSDVLPAPSQPVPCSTAKSDISPNDWSESNENDDSLEQADKRDPDSIQKDLSPTIFDMTEDSLCTNEPENATQAQENIKKSTVLVEVPRLTTEKNCMFLSNTNFASSTPIKKSIDMDELPSPTIEKDSFLLNTHIVSSTPNNSIMSLKVSSLKQYESESEGDVAATRSDTHTNFKTSMMKFNEASPIVSGGASIEDHLPHMISNTGSPIVRRKIENIPIVSGAYSPQVEDCTCRKSPKSSNASAWVVDMSSNPKLEVEKSAASTCNLTVKQPMERVCETRNSSKSSLDSCNSHENFKSRSSVNSDSSEKSSHKFYIDLSSLPDPIPPNISNQCDNISEKKNIFSMYIDLGEQPTLKEMPARLSSSLHTRNNAAVPKNVSKSSKSGKTSINDCCLNNITPFQKYESLCNDLNLDISEIISISATEPLTTEMLNKKNHSDIEIDKTEKSTAGFVRDKCKPKSNPNKANATQDPESSVRDQPTDLFVKLSDLDRPVHKADTTYVIQEEKVLDVRMTKSIPENNWGEQNIGSSCRSIEVISSFHAENAPSLNRLFPHLRNEFSKSMPVSLSGRTRTPRFGATPSPGDFQEQASDISEISSVQSSVGRSVIENSTTEETSQAHSLIGNCQSRLGQDLLRMFLEEIAPDVIVEVSGRRIKAHKCILSSRCQFFAGILSGGWVESSGNVIPLPPFSFNVVHFALCHIYSGVSTIPDSISILELATITDMLGLEGLKEAIMFTLKAKYCHNFHRPCQVCTAGVLECFPLSSVYALDDLYRKCLRWITKYFSIVWPTKAFATLPKELLDKCYQQHIINLTTENFVDTIYGCGVTVASLQNSRWAETVARMCQRLVNAAAQFAAQRLVEVLQTLARPRARALAPPDAPHTAGQALEDCLATAIERAPPDEACRAYAYLTALIKEIRTQQHSKSEPNKSSGHHHRLFSEATGWRKQCESALVRAAPRVVTTQAFKDLPPELRKTLRELGCITYGDQTHSVTMSAPPHRGRRSRSTYHSQIKAHDSFATRSFDIDRVRASFVPYSPKPATSVGSVDVLKSNNDLRDRKVKGAVPPKIRTTKAQEERAKFNLIKNNQSKDRSSNKSTSSRMSFENTKPRYLEPKVTKVNEKKLNPANKLVPKMISSSESSRNSSPIQARRLRSSRMTCGPAVEGRALAMSQDSLGTCTAEPSTDSLTESLKSNKYATYTKTKHTIKGSIESVNSSKVQNTSSSNRLKTKIPVYLNQSAKSTYVETKHEPQKRNPQVNKNVPSTSTGVTTNYRSKIADRKVPGSLMNATKSSSAKMVPKIVKEATNIKSFTKQSKKTESQANKQLHHEELPFIPVMERSGTFLKDEPTFGDKTTNIDIEQ